MSATVHTLRPEQGPPETSFEREAVAALLERIREFREETGGRDPDMVAYVLLGSGEDTLTRKCGWMDWSHQSTLCRLTMAGAMLTDAGLRP